MNTNKLTLRDFNNQLAIIFANIAGTWNLPEIMSFTYEGLRFAIINRAKNMNLVPENQIEEFNNIILNLSDYKMQSLRTALGEYSSVIWSNL